MSKFDADKAWRDFKPKKTLTNDYVQGFVDAFRWLQDEVNITDYLKQMER